MSIPAPMLPQERDGVVTTALINASGGLIVRIPRYTDAARNDVVIILLNNKIEKVITLNDGAELPENYIINSGYNIEALNNVKYNVIDSGGNTNPSLVKYFTVSNDTDATLTLTTTSGAVANGIDTNQVTVLVTENNTPSSGKNVILTIIGSAVFTNQSNTITVITNNNGEARANFSSRIQGIVTIRATYGEQSKESTSSFSGQTSSPVLLSTVINDNEPAGGYKIYILYELRDSNGQPISQETIRLSSPSTNISFTNNVILTDANGKAYALVSSSTAGAFTIVATYAYIPSVSNNSTVIFREATLYSIRSTTIVDNAAADGISTNQISFKVYDEKNNKFIGDQLLQVSINGPVSYPSEIWANGNNEYILRMTSINSGSFIGNVKIASTPLVTQQFSTTFTGQANTYPIMLGSNTVWQNGFMSIESFLAEYNLVSGHVYKIEFSRPRTAVYNCAANYVYNMGTKSCVTYYADSFQFYNTDLTHFRVLSSGRGSSLRSKRYYYYNPSNTGYGTVAVWDYGYSNSTMFDQEEFHLIDVPENQDLDNTEPLNAE